MDMLQFSFRIAIPMFLPDSAFLSPFLTAKIIEDIYPNTALMVSFLILSLKTHLFGPVQRKLSFWQQYLFGNLSALILSLAVEPNQESKHTFRNPSKFSRVSEQQQLPVWSVTADAQHLFDQATFLEKALTSFNYQGMELISLCQHLQKGMHK